MARDRREEILAYLMILLHQVTPLTGIWRNRGAFNADDLPVAVLLDGTEEILTEIKGLQLTQMPVALFTLLPEIFIILKPRADESNLTVNINGVLTPAPIGPELSAYRSKVIKVLTTDTNLYTMLGPDGQVEYRGSETDMRTANTLQGMMLMHFALSYVLNPDEL